MHMGQSTKVPGSKVIHLWLYFVCKNKLSCHIGIIGVWDKGRVTIC